MGFISFCRLPQPQELFVADAVSINGVLVMIHSSRPLQGRPGGVNQRRGHLRIYRSIEGLITQVFLFLISSGVSTKSPSSLAMRCTDMSSVEVEKVDLESYERISKYQDLNKLQVLAFKIRTKISIKIRNFTNSIYSVDHSFLSAIDDIVGENKMSADPIDCYSLYEDILERKPQCILELELGPGASTIAICLAILK